MSTVAEPTAEYWSSSKRCVSRSLRTVGLFAGIGGIELGLERAGHATVSLCEIDPAATAVLKARFPNLEVLPDIEEYHDLPQGTQLITAGFPCQDLSQAGRTLGVDGGARSGLVEHVFRLLFAVDVQWVLLENVPFMLHLGRGRSMALIIDTLEHLGYMWAYRVVNTRAFGLPQRRERVFLLASRTEDPRTVLLVDDAGDHADPDWAENIAVGFYWTEGRGGLGWAVDAVPTLKTGSTVGIASPPGIVLPSGEIVKPGIRDAERLQGFDADWTKPAEAVVRPSFRWKLTGNAVTVDVAQWIGERLMRPGRYEPRLDEPLPAGSAWPRSAYNVGEGRYYADVSAWPVYRRGPHLHDFLTYEDLTPLSLKAVSGFLSRYQSGGLRKSARFLQALYAHKARMERESKG